MNYIWLIAAVCCCAAVATFLYQQNNKISISVYSYCSTRLPSGFDGLKIVHISDLQSKSFGEGQKKLLTAVRRLAPDIVVISGDVIDRRRFNLENARVLVHGLADMCPVYFVSGNHEIWSGKYDLIIGAVEAAGAVVAENKSVKLQSGEEYINIIGLKDPAYVKENGEKGTDIPRLMKSIKEIKGEDTFNILISHRPELIDIYSDNGIDIVFSGHAHGGQVRLPFIGGLYAPNQGIFPKYTKGIYTKG